MSAENIPHYLRVQQTIEFIKNAQPIELQDRFSTEILFDPLYSTVESTYSIQGLPSGMSSLNIISVKNQLTWGNFLPLSEEKLGILTKKAITENPNSATYIGALAMHTTLTQLVQSPLFRIAHNYTIGESSRASTERRQQLEAFGIDPEGYISLNEYLEKLTQYGKTQGLSFINPFA